MVQHGGLGSKKDLAFKIFKASFSTAGGTAVFENASVTRNKN